MPGEGIEVGKVSVGVEFDTKQMRRQQSELKRTSEEIGQKMGSEQAKAAIQAAESVFRNDIARIKEAQARGLLSPKDAEKAAREAAREFNRTMVREIDRAGADPTFRRTEAFQIMGDSLKNVGEEGRRAGLGLGRLNDSMVQVFRQASGANPILGRLVDTLGTFAIGVGPMVAILAGLAAIAAAWSKITEKTREAREETKEALEVLRELAEQERIEALGPGGAQIDALQNARRRQAEIEVRMEQIRQTAAPALLLSLPFGGQKRVADRLEKELDELQKEYDELEQFLKEREERIIEIRKEAREKREQQDISNLQALVASNRATAAERQRLVEIVRLSQEELARLAEEDPTAEVLQRRAELASLVEQSLAALKGKMSAEQKAAIREAEQAAAQLARLEDDIVTRLTRLTRTATDELLLELDRLEAQAREAAAKAGRAVPEGLLEGLEKLRQDASLRRVFESFQERFEDVGRLDRDAQASPLDALITDLERANAGLEEGSVIQEQINDLLARAVELRQKNADAAKREREQAEKTADAEKKKAAAAAEQAERDRIRDLRESARLIEENARAALQFASALGVVDERAARVLESFVQIGTAVKRIAGKDFTAIPSLIGGLAQLISALGTNEEEARKRAELIQAMNDLRDALTRLAENTDALASLVLGANRSVLPDARSFLEGGRSERDILGAATVLGIDPAAAQQAGELMLEQMEVLLRMAFEAARRQIEQGLLTDLAVREAELAGDDVGGARIRATSEARSRQEEAFDLLQRGLISQEEYARLLAVIAADMERAIEAAEEAQARAEELAERQRRAFKADLVARELALEGRTVESETVRLQDEAAQELASAQDFLNDAVEAGTMTAAEAAAMYERLARVLDEETRQAIEDLIEAAQRQAEAFDLDLEAREARLRGDTEAEIRARHDATAAQQMAAAQALVDAGVIAEEELLRLAAVLDGELAQALERSAEAAEAASRQFDEDLEVRRLEAQGRKEEAALRRQELAHEEQLRQAREAGRTAEQIAELQRVQAAERDALIRSFQERAAEALGTESGAAAGVIRRDVTGITTLQAVRMVDQLALIRMDTQQIAFNTLGLRNFVPPVLPSASLIAGGQAGTSTSGSSAGGLHFHGPLIGNVTVADGSPASAEQLADNLDRELGRRFGRPLVTRSASFR